MDIFWEYVHVDLIITLFGESRSTEKLNLKTMHIVRKIFIAAYIAMYFVAIISTLRF